MRKKNIVFVLKAFLNITVNFLRQQKRDNNSAEDLLDVSKKINKTFTSYFGINYSVEEEDIGTLGRCRHRYRSGAITATTQKTGKNYTNLQFVTSQFGVYHLRITRTGFDGEAGGTKSNTHF